MMPGGEIEIGTLIRHAGAHAAVSALSVTMIEPSFGASLVAMVSTTALTAPGFETAAIAAVTPPSAVAVPADPEHRVTSDCRTNLLTKNHLAMTIHVRPEAGLDNGDRLAS